MSPRRLLIFALLSARASRHGCRAFTVTRLSSLSPSISHLPSVSIESVPSAQGDGAEEAGETAANAENVITVALTRELGKNSKLRDALEVHPAAAAMGAAVVAVEIPCIEHAAGADAAALADLLSAPAKDGGGSGIAGSYDYVVVTSPEASRVFGEAVRSSGVPWDEGNAVKIAAVGKATEKALGKEGFSVSFVPSEATGETLAAELPPLDDDGREGPARVLYPASAKAANTIQEGLESRSGLFEVTRLDTYDTVSAAFSEDQASSIDEIDIACFGSPSAVESWLQNVDSARGLEDLDDEEKRKLGPKGNGDVKAACIGKTTAQACIGSGRWHSNDIYYSMKNPGVDSWIESTVQAVGELRRRGTPINMLPLSPPVCDFLRPLITSPEILRPPWSVIGQLTPA